MNAPANIEPRGPALEKLASMLRDSEFIVEMHKADDTTAELVEFWEQINETADEYRHETLVWFARSPWWHMCGMMLTGWQGKLHRDAWRALSADLAKDTPGRRWDAAPYARGRASIARLLGCEGHPGAGYITAAFRAWIDDDDRSWIAGAVGCPRCFDLEALENWRHLDIEEVILWCPRTGEARLAGEHESTARLILPCEHDTSLTVWGDAGAFFRAWAANRRRLAEMVQRKAMGEWAHPVIECPDGELPGALIVGDVGAVRWADVSASTIIAGPGVTKSELRAAALRAARLPNFTEGGDARG